MIDDAILVELPAVTGLPGLRVRMSRLLGSPVVLYEVWPSVEVGWVEVGFNGYMAVLETRRTATH